MRAAPAVARGLPRARSTLLLLAVVRWVLRGLWFLVIPLLLAGLALRYLVPHASTASGFEGALSEAWRGHALLLALCLFLAFVALFRYWRNWLPGGRYLSSLPAEFVTRVPRQRIAECETACAVLKALESRAAKRGLAAAPVERRTLVGGAREALQGHLAAGKWSKVPTALAQLERLVSPLLGARSLQNSLRFALLLGAVGLLALQLRLRIVQAYEVTGNSMLPTFTPEQVLAGSLVAYARGRLPQRGDVVVLHVQVDGQDHELVKRVVGLPGDHIGMWGVHPIINGWSVPLCDVGAYYRPDDAQNGVTSSATGGRLVMEFLESEAYLTFQTVPAAPFPEYVVKPGEVFVLGDNRSGSRDSRAFDQGAPRGFPLATIRAKIVRVLFSRARRGEIELGSVLRPLRVTATLDGADMSVVQARVNACLAVRPKFAGPPRSPSPALALHD